MYTYLHCHQQHQLKRKKKKKTYSPFTHLSYIIFISFITETSLDSEYWKKHSGVLHALDNLFERISQAALHSQRYRLKINSPPHPQGAERNQRGIHSCVSQYSTQIHDGVRQGISCGGRQKWLHLTLCVANMSINTVYISLFVPLTLLQYEKLNEVKSASTKTKFSLGCFGSLQ